MSNLVTREREKYDGLWASMSAYGKTSPGQQLVPVFESMVGQRIGTQWILDAGCGSGRGGVALAEKGYRVILCDTTAAGLCDEARDLPFAQVNLWDSLDGQLDFIVDRFDYVYCCDVLEHIPTPFTMLVVSRLLEVATRGVFLSISTVPDNFGAWVGQPLHVSLQSFVEWRDQLSALGRVVEARDLVIAGAYLVEPTC